MARLKRTDQTVYEADDSAVIKSPGDLKEADVERKDAYLKRIKAEDQENRKIYTKTEEWIEIVAGKVLLKHKTKANSEYTAYLFNAKKFPVIVDQMKKDGFFMLTDAEKGNRKVSLRSVEGKLIK